MKKLKVFLETAVVTGLGTGLAPTAPGTFGSLLGLPLGAGIFYLVSFAFPGQYFLVGDISTEAFAAGVGILIVLSIGGLFVIESYEKRHRVHDDKKIVLDEVLGQAIGIFFLTPSLKSYVIAFAFFRFFDILKPGPIGWIDLNWPGARGTLCDDLLAGGVVAALMLTLRSFAVL
jgi:phosphatidylglycerophosphatase A